MSRPSWSVPRTARVPSAALLKGGVNRARRRCSVGSNGASRLGAAAQIATSTRIIVPIRAPPEARSVPRDRDGRSGEADAGVESDIDHVDQDVEEEDGRA